MSQNQLLAAQVGNLPASQITSGVGMQNLADSTLGSSATNITFSTIAQTYKNLEDSVQGRADGAFNNDNLSLQFNTDTGANYDATDVENSNVTPAGRTSLGQTSLNLIFGLAAASTTVNTAGTSRILIPNYTSTVFNKSLVAEAGVCGQTAGAMTDCAHVAGTWRNTAALTAIKHFPASGPNFVTGTRATLQGIQ